MFYKKRQRSLPGPCGKGCHAPTWSRHVSIASHVSPAVYLAEWVFCSAAPFPECLTAAIRNLQAGWDGVYGSPKICQILHQQGEWCGNYRIAPLMWQAGLQGIHAPRRWKRQKSGARPAGITNQLVRDFTSTAPNAKWVTDITYSLTQEGWLYPAVVLDMFSRQVIGGGDAAPAHPGCGHSSRVDGRLARERSCSRHLPFRSGYAI